MFDRYVQEYTLVSGDIVGLVTSATNFDFVNINKPTNSIFYGNTIYTGVFENAIRQVGAIGTNSYADNVNRIYYLMPSNNTLYAYAVPKGTYANLTAAQTALAGTKIWYQLATPQLAQSIINTSGILNGKQAGTVYIRSSVQHDATHYTTKADISKTQFPIQKLDSILRLNADGTYTKLATSTAVIAGDKLSFTHPNLTANDIVFFVYTYANGINGNSVITFYDNKFVVVAPNGTVYRWQVAVDNAGVATLTTTAI